MEIFINLVDSGAQVKAFRNQLNLSKDEIETHMKSLDYYRNYVNVFRSIQQIRRSAMTQPEKMAAIAALRNRLDEL